MELFSVLGQTAFLAIHITAAVQSANHNSANPLPLLLLLDNVLDICLIISGALIEHRIHTATRSTCLWKMAVLALSGRLWLLTTSTGL